MKLSVVVPTYHRTADLARCLAALDAQHRRADEVVVIARADDHETLAWLRERKASAGGKDITDPTVSLVHIPGVVAAYNCGIETSHGDIVCFTDDDAAPHPDWTERILLAFGRDPALGGLGGRDIVHERERILTGRHPLVGLVRWYGRPIGNHHIGHGAAREVDVLKGVNMAFRRTALGTVRFDPRLRGSGAQVHCEMALCLSVQRQGWKLVYDPTLLVDHYPAPRGDEDQRYTFNDKAFYNASFNLRLIMCEHLSTMGRMVFVVYASLVGNRADPGLARALMLAFASDGIVLALRKWWLGLRALRAACQEAMRSG